MKLVPLSKDKIDGMVTLWNKEIGNDFPMRKELLEQNSLNDENVLQKGSALALDEKGNVVGFVIAKAWQEKINVNRSRNTGWIQALLVDSNFRNQGIGTLLLAKAEQAFNEQNLSSIKIGSDPWHYFPGIPDSYEAVKSWFEKHDYHFDGNEYDLICHYYDDQNPVLTSYENITFSLLQLDEKDQFLAFLQRCFPGRWEYEAIHYFKKGGTGREFVVAKKGTEIIGFCRINDQQSPFIAQNVYWSPLFETPLGGVGPLGVAPEERKKGYGLAVVEAGIAFLRERNIQQIVIDWTGLVHFYAKLGYEVWKTYSRYSKKI